MTRATVRGVELDYDLQGDGPTLVWGHGLSSNRQNEDEFGLLHWDRLAVGRRLLRYDARGHGRSDYTADPATYAWSELALDQLALADAAGVDRYVAGGASMGCGTALHAVLTAPERIQALILVIPPTAWETRAERVEIWEQVAGLIEHKGIEGFIAGMASMPSPDPLAGRTEWDDRAAANARRSDPVRLAGLFRGAGTADLPSRDQTATITAPTLILAWTGDPGHPRSTAEQLAELIPGSRLSLASTWDELQAWTDQALAFLDTLD